MDLRVMAWLANDPTNVPDARRYCKLIKEQLDKKPHPFNWQPDNPDYIFCVRFKKKVGDFLKNKRLDGGPFVDLLEMLEGVESDEPTSDGVDSYS